MEETYRVIESIEDQMRDVVTVEGIRPDGSWGSRVVFDGKAVRDLGLVACLKRVGWRAPTGRLPVRQHGRVIGTVPADFEPRDLKRGIFYDPRPGDFKREADAWVAVDTLGPGDFEHYVPGFIWEPSTAP